jgi:hypothetical protein
METVMNFLKEFWRQAMSVLQDLADWIISVFDPNSGPWPKITVGLVFLLVVLLVVSRTSRAR